MGYDLRGQCPAAEKRTCVGCWDAGSLLSTTGPRSCFFRGLPEGSHRQPPDRATAMIACYLGGGLLQCCEVSRYLARGTAAGTAVVQYPRLLPDMAGAWLRRQPGDPRPRLPRGIH